MKLVRYFATCPEDAPGAWLFPHPVAWAVMMALGIIVAIWAEVTGFHFTAVSLNSALPSLMLLISVSLWCMYRNIAPVIPYLTFALMFYFTLNIIFASGNCLGVALQFPMVDAQMAAFDQMIGFDWPAHIRWVNDHALISKILDYTYYSLDRILVVTVIALFAMRRYDRLQEVMILILATGTITLIIGTLWPVLGAYGFYDLSAGDIANMPKSAGRYYHAQMIAIHDGTLRELVLSDYKGLVGFPSFHTVLALLTSWALRRTVIFWPMAVINAVMIISTLSYGGHHLADVLGGFAVTAITIWIYSIIHDRYPLSDANPLSLPGWLHSAIFRLTGTPPNEQPAQTS